MINVLAWAVTLGGILVLIAAAQCIKLYLLRNWRTTVQLPDPVAYTDFPSFRSDQEIVLRIHSSEPVTVHFNRRGEDGFVPVHQIKAPAQAQSHVMHRWRGFDWKDSVTLPPHTLAHGFYRIDLRHHDASRSWSLPLIVSQPTPQPVMVVASTNTWNAYNDFGGLSNYKDRANPQPLKAIRRILGYFNIGIRVGERHWIAAVPLPERRPNSRVHRDFLDNSGVPSHLAREEAVLIGFLEREGSSYSVISDRDFAYNMDASQARLIIFNTHPEYWSEEMFGRLNEFLHRGVSAAFLSGNNMYRKIQFMENSISVIDRRTPPEQIVPLIGVYYDPYGYMTYDAYRVVDSGHWCFAGLGLRNDSEFGEGNAKRPAASGYETDKIRAGSDGFRVLAIGKNPEGPAFMVCRDFSSGGFVFAAGSVSFAPCVGDDPTVQGLVRNLIRRALAASTAGQTGTPQVGG